MKCTVSLSPSGNIQLEIPSVLAAGRSHVVEIPLSLNGISLLKKILLDRKADPQSSLGKLSSPVASQVHEYLVKKTRDDQAEAKRTSDDVQKKFNITLDL